MDEKHLRSFNIMFWIVIPLLIYQKFASVFHSYFAYMFWNALLMAFGVLAILLAVRSKSWLISIILGAVAVIVSALAFMP
jgi:4-amino-4-deoxy-L-arabinose transferase-like glycosyltransferase